MDEVFKVLGSLVRPLGGFFIALATGQFGWGRTLSVANLVLWQSVLVAIFMSTHGFGTLVTIAGLTLIHLVCSFLLLTMLLGSAFTRGNADIHKFAQEGFGLVAVVSGIATVLFLGVVALISATPFVHFAIAAIASTFIGTAIDVTGVLGPFQKAMEANEAAAPATVDGPVTETVTPPAAPVPTGEAQPQ